MKETYKVRCPKRIVFGDPQYFEQLKGAKLKSLTVDYKPRSHFTSRVVIEEKPFERFPQRNELTLNIYFAPEDEVLVEVLVPDSETMENLRQYVNYFFKDVEQIEKLGEGMDMTQ